ncbi:MAG: isocitrate/isopropylmalate dehydrogenase family protein [Chloroflexi bacterium]|nr:isocitrate/isopropylmalate dehydrogenase family protein [Chloroflexota bacterium]
MAKYKIAWLPGDGIGVDVLDAVKIVLDAIELDAEYIPGEIGWECWEKYGDALPPHTVDLLKSTDCCMFGAITSKPNVKGYRSPIVRLRQMFNLYINMRPIKAFEGNPLNYNNNIDMVIFRENTEDLYMGIEFEKVPDEWRKTPGMERVPESAGISLRVITPEGSERIIRAAFEYARKHGRKRVTVVHKANVIRVTDGIFLEAAARVKEDYPEIEMEDVNVDALTMWLIKKPEWYDVVVTTNMFGDIISDEASQLVGGLGFAASGNIGDKYGVFEPSHGSAPKYAGQYKVNPIAAILASKIMLDWLGETEKAERIQKAVATVMKEGKAFTYDLGGTAGTLDVARAVAGHISAPV